MNHPGPPSPSPPSPPHRRILTTELVDEEAPSGARIKVVGIGGGGGNAINTMIAEGLAGVEFIAMNTDAPDLRRSLPPRRLQLGAQLTKGLGAGANPEVGREAALEDRDRIAELVVDADMVLVTAGMGGGTGTGTGAAPIIAQVARECGALTVGVVTRPFGFEGKRRRRQAQEGIEALAANVDTLITIPNQRLIGKSSERTSMKEAFRMADEVLLQAVRGVSDLINYQGQVNVDFTHVRAAMSGKGMARMGVGIGKGDHKTVEAAQAAISSPLLDDVRMVGATSVLINITGGEHLSPHEAREALTVIREEVHQCAQVLFGVVVDQSLGDEVRVTVIGTGLEDVPPPLPPSPPRPPEAGAGGRSLYLAFDLTPEADDSPTFFRVG